MVDRTSSRESTGRRVQRTIEHYTPDGALGRFLFGSVTGSLGLWFLAWAILEPTMLLLPIVLLGLAVSLLTLSVTTLWPVYLSLVGNLESPEEYGVDRTETSEITEEDPIAALKRRYASGELSESEFERRLDTLLEADDPGRTRSNVGADVEREFSTET